MSHYRKDRLKYYLVQILSIKGYLQIMDLSNNAFEEEFLKNREELRN